MDIKQRLILNFTTKYKLEVLDKILCLGFILEIPSYLFLYKGKAVPYSLKKNPSDKKITGGIKRKNLILLFQ